MIRAGRQLVAIAGWSLGLLLAGPAAAEEPTEQLPLVDGEGAVGDAVLETLLAPAEFPGRRFFHVSRGEEAAFCVDSSLGSTTPHALLYPRRVAWPRVAGLELAIVEESLELVPANAGVDDAALDAGFGLRWTLEPLGQRFAPAPHFAVRIVGAEVFSEADGRVLLAWHEPAPPPVCGPAGSPFRPACDLGGVSREARALALAPDGALLAVAVSGLRPRIEIYDIAENPRMLWQSLFPGRSGGVVEAAFSADGRWVVALTGDGVLHRYDAASGGRHLTIPSQGRTAIAVPPGRMIAVAGERGEVTLWYLADGTIAWRLPPRQLRGPVDRLAASGDGRRFATLEYDADRTVVRVWEVHRRAMLAQIEVDPYAVADVALDETGDRLYVAHEERGLLRAEVTRRGSAPQPVGGADGARCTGRLQWISGLGLLSCAVARGMVQVDADGKLARELETGVAASEWIMAAAAGGERIAAVGAGHLLIWWPAER